MVRYWRFRKEIYLELSPEERKIRLTGVLRLEFYDNSEILLIEFFQPNVLDDFSVFQNIHQMELASLSISCPVAVTIVVF